MSSLIAGHLRAKARWLHGSDRPRHVLKALVTDGTLAMIAYRLMQACQRLHLAPLAMFFINRNLEEYMRTVAGNSILGAPIQGYSLWLSVREA